MNTPASNTTPFVDLDDDLDDDIPAVVVVKFAGRRLRIVIPDSKSLKRLTSIAELEISEQMSLSELMEAEDRISYAIRQMLHPADVAKFDEAREDETQRISIEKLVRLFRSALQHLGRATEATNRPLPGRSPSAPSRSTRASKSKRSSSKSGAPKASTTSRHTVPSRGSKTVSPEPKTGNAPSPRSKRSTAAS